VFREITLLRQLSQMKNNVFTTKLYDIIVPADTQEEFDQLAQGSLFLVIDYVDHDLKYVFGSDRSFSFTEEHVITILYNLLCALNFLHTANIVHRDIKPANILIDSECSIKVCDFGLARTLPEMPQGKRVSGKASTGTQGSMDTADNSPNGMSQKSEKEEKIQRRRDMAATLTDERKDR